MAAAPPALPPQVADQVESPEGAESVFSQQGLPQEQPGMEALKMALDKVQELDRWAGDMKQLLQQLHPPLMTLMQPIAQAGLDMQKALTELAKRSGMQKGSPQGAPPAAQNPAAGVPNPQG